MLSVAPMLSFRQKALQSTSRGRWWSSTPSFLLVQLNRRALPEAIEFRSYWLGAFDVTALYFGYFSIVYIIGQVHELLDFGLGNGARWAARLPFDRPGGLCRPVRGGRQTRAHRVTVTLNTGFARGGTMDTEREEDAGRATARQAVREHRPPRSPGKTTSGCSRFTRAFQSVTLLSREARERIRLERWRS